MYILEQKAKLPSSLTSSCTGKLSCLQRESIDLWLTCSKANKYSLHQNSNRDLSSRNVVSAFRNYSCDIYTLNENNTLLHTSIVGEAGFCSSLSSVWATSPAVDRSTLSAIFRAFLLTLKLAVNLTKMHCCSNHGR